MQLLRLSAHITVNITIALICTEHMLSDSIYFLDIMYISILIVVGTCTRSCARARVSRQSRARRAKPRAAKPRVRVSRSRVSACRGEAALRRVAAKPRAEAAACRGKAARGEAACPRFAAKPPCDPPCGRAQLVYI